MSDKIRALVACQIDECAEEVSYPLDMVSMLNGKPICRECYIAHKPFEGTPGWVPWEALPSVELRDLKE